MTVSLLWLFPAANLLTGELKLLRRMLDSEDVSALLRVQGIVG